ncbi:protein-methionine-sulfoxide reductase heme-binding subunit MsrQ [Roseivivax sp. CAU 1753]
MTLVDRTNRLARWLPIWAVYLTVAAPAPYFFYLGLTGGLGVEPIKALEHEYGEFALKLLIAGLCVTPLRRHLGVNLLRFRRAIGLLAFFYLTLHLMVWLLLDVQIAGQIWADILKRPYITIGMAGFLLLVPLALSSNNWSVRRLGPRWRQLHRLVYPAILLGGIHFVMLRKGFQLEPLIYLAIIVVLLAMRLDWRAVPGLRRA